MLVLMYFRDRENGVVEDMKYFNRGPQPCSGTA